MCGSSWKRRMKKEMKGKVDEEENGVEEKEKGKG